MKQCVILVGGKGSRLGEITKKFPKPMLEFDSKPFLLHLINQLKSFGFTKIVLLAGHAAEVVEEYFKKNKLFGVSIEIIKEKELLGTGGALINAYDLLEDQFFLMNGDSMIDGNWLPMNNLLNEENCISMALVKMSDCSRFGSVVLKDNKVISFLEKQNSNSEGLINGGIYCIQKKILRDYKVERLSFENDILSNFVEKQKVSGKEINGYFIDIGIPESLEEAKKKKWIANKKAVVFDRDGTLNYDNGYTHRVSDLKWKEGAIKLLKFLNDSNILVFVATNQAGIAKGIFHESDMHKFHLEMQHQLRNIGAHIDGFYFCPYHIDAKVSQYKLDSDDRKPKTGMLKKICEEFSLEKENMLMIGDRDTDIQCAENFNISSILYNGIDNLFSLSDNIIKKLRI